MERARRCFYLDENAEEARAQDEQYGDILGLKNFRRGIGRIAAQRPRFRLTRLLRDVHDGLEPVACCAGLRGDSSVAR